MTGRQEQILSLFISFLSFLPCFDHISEDCFPTHPTPSSTLTDPPPKHIYFLFFFLFASLAISGSILNVWPLANIRKFSWTLRLATIYFYVCFINKSYGIKSSHIQIFKKIQFFFFFSKFFNQRDTRH